LPQQKIAQEKKQIKLYVSCKKIFYR